MPLATEVDLGPGHIVLDGDPAPPAKGTQQPHPFLAHVYCGHGHPSQLLLKSCSFGCNLTLVSLSDIRLINLRNLANGC